MVMWLIWPGGPSSHRIGYGLVSKQERHSRPAIISPPKTRIATASITVDEVQVSVHVGSTRATDKEIMAALDAVVDKLCEVPRSRKEVA